MYNQKMYELGSKRSVIRELFEFGKQRAKEVGEDNVYDFSLGNPNVPTPAEVTSAILKYAQAPAEDLVHGYTSAQGDAKVRQIVADDINKKFGVGIGANNIYMTCGAAAALCISVRALNEDNDEFVLIKPYFPEYTVFVESMGGKCVPVSYQEPSFGINFDELEKAITNKTKAVIVNSPNNPCGVVYSEDTIKKLASLLTKKSEQFGKPIFIIADEPYRELVYDNVLVPYVMNYYDNTIVCYSFSKSLSLPGERIGYIAVSPKAHKWQDLYSAVCGAGRALGYVCAPSTFQRVVADCIGAKPDIDAYRKNRDLIFNALCEMGYECVHPDGAFYLFVKALESDANAFSQKAKELGLLLVPGDDFGANGYVRISYCVSNDMIKRSLPAFEKLIESYKK